MYETDLQQADKEIVIFSPEMNKAIVTKTLALIKDRQLAGVSVNIITIPAKGYREIE